MNLFILSLNVNFINTIISALNELPHKISRPIIDEIVNQSQKQLDQNIQN